MHDGVFRGRLSGFLYTAEWIRLFYKNLKSTQKFNGSLPKSNLLARHFSAASLVPTIRMTADSYITVKEYHRKLTVYHILFNCRWCLLTDFNWKTRFIWFPAAIRHRHPGCCLWPCDVVKFIGRCPGNDLCNTWPNDTGESNTLWVALSLYDSPRIRTFLEVSFVCTSF